MKNSVKITTSILILIFSFSSFGFSQEEVRIQKSKTLMFDGESKKAEVKVKSTSEYNYLRLSLACSLLEGDVTIEIINPKGEREGMFTVKSDKTTSIGNKTTVEETVNGTMHKTFSKPLHGDWIIRATPSGAKGKVNYNIAQGFEPRIDIINIREIK